MASNTRSRKPHIPITVKIATLINEYDGDNFDAFLKAYDWHAVPTDEIVPCEKIREIIKGIDDKEKKIQTAKFFCKYGDYYFKKGTEFIWKKYWSEFDNFRDFAFVFYGTEDPLAAFHSELLVLIEQLESDGEFSVKKFDKIKAENLEMKKQMDAIAEVFNLKTREDWANFDQAINRWQENSQVIERLQSEKAALLDYIKEQTAQLLLLESAPITIDQICEYAKEYLDRSERQIISHMLLNIIENPDKDTRAKIKALDKKTPLDAKTIVLGDKVENKIVKS